MKGFDVLAILLNADYAGMLWQGLRLTVVVFFGSWLLAMSLALVGLLVPDVWIEDPRCVGKTFPDYFERLGELTGVRAPGFDSSASVG